jgi:crotonobetainyl-CoA:carnitine CoA-transferase CaiB-like acyl-CoA transferase
LEDTVVKSSPLAGIRVVDLTVDRGELCGRLLADLGADVIKVEPPGGSPARELAPHAKGVGLFFAYRNAGKRSVIIDVASNEAPLHELLAHSDVAILSCDPGNDLDPHGLAAQHPHLGVTAISAYGLTGPYTGRVATDSVLAATSSIAYKAGIPEKAPLCPPNSFVDDGASFAFAFGTLCAIWQRGESGSGQVLDCSVNEAIANQGDWAMVNNYARVLAGEPVNEVRNGAGPLWPSFRCVDGFVRVVMLAPRQWRAMRAWLGEPDFLQDPELDGLVARLGLSEVVINPLIEELFRDKTMEEISAEAQRRGIVCTPLATPADVLTNEHFLARGSLVEIELAPGVRGPIPSGFLEFGGDRAGPRSGPPAVGEHTDAVFANLGPRRAAPVVEGANETEYGLPLEGLRVADFGHGGVGVEIGRMFAEYGADVIKIESRSYPDFIRISTGMEMCPSFASSSRSKRAFAANAKTPEGREVLKKLAMASDVVIENNSTGVMDELGLGYEVLSALHPGIVMLSSQLMGSRGPWAQFRGYGPSTRAAGGIERLWNYDDQDEPAGGSSIFPDHLTGRVGALGALAGLLGRRRGDGSGAHVEVAQVEVTIGIVGELLTREALVPGSVKATGNRRDRGAPWGLFPCAGEQQWVAITCRDDRDWTSLVEVMGSPDWATSTQLAHAAKRHENAAEIELGVAEWTKGMKREEVAARCQVAGIPAGEMLTGLETLENEHFLARGFRVEIEQHGNLTPTLILDGPGFTGSKMAAPRITAAPLVGEHTREICREQLGMDEAEIERLVASVVLEVTPPVELAD